MEGLSKHNILGVRISATTYIDAVDAIIKAAKLRVKCCVSALAVHGLVSGVLDPQLWSILNDFDLLTPDGQPIRLAPNFLYKVKLSDQVYVPFLMMHLCQRVMEENIRVHFYRSTKNVIARLKMNYLKGSRNYELRGLAPLFFDLLRG